MTNKPLTHDQVQRLLALNPRAKASLITAFAGTGGKSNTANYAMNMLFAPPGFSPADIVPGIIAANNCGEWMDQMISDGIDLDALAHARECQDEYCECELEQGETLIGDWHQVEEWHIRNRIVKPRTKGSKRRMVWAEYTEEHEGADGFAAIWSPTTYDITVVWSKWVYRGGRWCSPCAPGQASIPHGDTSFDPTTDGVSCYVLPPDLHLCFECHTFDRPVVYAQHYYGAMLCAVCCERHDIDFRNGELRQGGPVGK